MVEQKLVSPIIVWVFALLPYLGCGSPSADTVSAENQSTDQTMASGGKSDIYGQDSRMEINDTQVPENERKNARSVGMIFNVRSAIDGDEQNIYFSRASMSDRFHSENGVPLCSDEAFADQIAPGYCTGFLIGPQLVATAGHCINGHTRCEQMGFAFDFASDENGNEPTSVKRENFYRCDTLVGRVYNPFEEPETITSGEYWYDWAVFKLDRPVTDRQPLSLWNGDDISANSPVYVLGHPSGLPMKYADGTVVSDDKARYFNTTLDIYQGNSGSPVFDQETGQVHGIVIRGSGGNSFEIVDRRCGRSKVCAQVGDPGCIGNHALRIQPVIPFAHPELKFAESHQLVTDDERPGLTQTLDMSDADGLLEMVTVHINGLARDPSKLIVRLKKGDDFVDVIHKPRSLPYGRWTATTDHFGAIDPNGEWTIEVRDEGGADVNIEWLQVMVGYR